MMSRPFARVPKRDVPVVPQVGVDHHLPRPRARVDKEAEGLLRARVGGETDAVRGDGEPGEDDLGGGRMDESLEGLADGGGGRVEGVRGSRVKGSWSGDRGGQELGGVADEVGV